MSILTALFDGNKIYNFEQAFGVKDITSAPMKAAIGDWMGLYYQTEPTDREDPCQRIPVAVVHKLSKTTFSEYEAGAAGSGPKTEYITSVLGALDVCRKKAMQQVLIGGQCYLKPIFLSKGVSFGVISRSDYLALGRDERGDLTDIGTAERTIVDRLYYTLLERRTVDADGCLKIESRLYRSNTEDILGTEIPLQALEKYAALEPVVVFPKPVGSIGLIPLRVPLENTVDGSLDAVSVYAPAAGLIHNINRNEAQLNGEFERGKSRIFVDDTLLERRDGRKALTDDVFVGVSGDYQSGGIDIFSPPLREASFLARKTEYLRNVESLIGLKRGLLSEVEAMERTATEVTSSAGDYNLSIIDLQEMWDGAVREAVRVCGVLGRMYKIYAGPEINPGKDVIINWGNGILYDEDQTWGDYKAMVAAGMLKPEIAVGWYFDMPTETEEDLQKIRGRYMPEVEEMAKPGDE